MENKSLKVSRKSKWFARLVLLAVGLVLSVGGILTTAHFVGGDNSDVGQEYAYANMSNGLTPGNLRISGSNLSWQFWWRESDSSARWHNMPGLNNSSAFWRPDTQHLGISFSNIQILRAGTVVHTLNWSSRRCSCDSGCTIWIPPAASVNMNSVAALAAVGSHNITVRANFREYSGGCCCRSPRFQRNSYTTSAVINRTVTGTLGVPGNVRMVGDVLHWNSVGNANGYRVYRGTTLVQAVGNVTSLNLAGNANVPVGTRHTLSVSATSTASYWHTSARGGSAEWGQLSTPTGVAVNGTTLSWNAVSNATGYQIRRGTTVIATVGNVTSHNLMSVSVANLAVGAHTNLNVVATTTTSGWISSAASANASWTRFAGLCVPSDVVLNGSTVSWGIGTNTFAFI
ncbi:MAG: hypothetical protein FWB72_04395, partial [Firmicutes bacterium]|nr:hypothetical protein [Bacillota bacterium]